MLETIYTTPKATSIDRALREIQVEMQGEAEKADLADEEKLLALVKDVRDENFH